MPLNNVYFQYHSILFTTAVPSQYPLYTSPKFPFPIKDFCCISFDDNCFTPDSGNRSERDEGDTCGISGGKYFCFFFLTRRKTTSNTTRRTSNAAPIPTPIPMIVVVGNCEKIGVPISFPCVVVLSTDVPIFVELEAELVILRVEVAEVKISVVADVVALVVVSVVVDVVVVSVVVDVVVSVVVDVVVSVVVDVVVVSVVVDVVVSVVVDVAVVSVVVSVVVDVVVVSVAVDVVVVSVVVDVAVVSVVVDVVVVSVWAKVVEELDVVLTERNKINH